LTYDDDGASFGHVEVLRWRRRSRR